MATTINSVASARGEKNRHGPQLPVIEHPIMRLGKKSELKIRGASPGYNSTRPASHQHSRAISQNPNKSIHFKLDNQIHDTNDDSDLPPLRTESRDQFSTNRKHNRLSTWPG